MSINSMDSERDFSEIPPEQFIDAAKKVVIGFYHTPQDTRKWYPFGEFGVSDPQIKDARSIESGNFNISDFRTKPSNKKPGIVFHFYIGDTEFHLSGEAAQDVIDKLDT